MEPLGSLALLILIVPGIAMLMALRIFYRRQVVTSSGLRMALSLAAWFLILLAGVGAGIGASEAQGIGPPETSTLEARLTAANGPARLIPTRLGQGLPAEEITALATRSGSAKNPTYFPFTRQSVTDFDWLAMLD